MEIITKSKVFWRLPVSDSRIAYGVKVNFNIPTTIRKCFDYSLFRDTYWDIQYYSAVEAVK